MSDGYDIIGDIHGHADKLTALLKHMGYRHAHGAWRHPGRKAVFVGDFIDRGPRQAETLRVVRDMVESGSGLAVMGNHEFNAVAWHTADPESAGDFLRPRTGALGGKNRKQHQAFLAEFEDRPSEHRHVVDWFLTLPLWLDLPGFRVVHACWMMDEMSRLKPALGENNTLTPELVFAASRRGSKEFDAVETLTKGIEVALPPGVSFIDKDLHVRTRVRVRWWERGDLSFRNAALLEDDIRRTLPDLPIPSGTLPGYTDDKPVFIGHYWMNGRPSVLSPKVACVDYSAGKGGTLVAYRWDGEEDLTGRNFVWAG